MVSLNGLTHKLPSKEVFLTRVSNYKQEMPSRSEKEIISAASGLAGGVTTAVAVPTVVHGIGFGAAGIFKGTMAAKMMSTGSRSLLLSSLLKTLSLTHMYSHITHIHKQISLF